jgi:hypothetical protein
LSLVFAIFVLVEDAELHNVLDPIRRNVEDDSTTVGKLAVLPKEFATHDLRPRPPAGVGEVGPLKVQLGEAPLCERPEADRSWTSHV